MGLDVDFTAISLFNPIVAIDLFHYSEQDIFVMTDEEKNMGTERWPSKENIVSIFAECSRLDIVKFNKYSFGP